MTKEKIAEKIKTTDVRTIQKLAERAEIIKKEALMMKI